MSYIEGVVYESPSAEYPPVVVFFKPDGEILAAQAAEDLEAAEQLLSQVVEGVRAKLDDAWRAAS
jgi:hypothetical protein